MTEFVLEILDGDRAGEIFELQSEPVTFGRRQGNDIVLPDEKCSGRHAMVVQEDGQWVLRDLESTNGTLLDGRRVEEVGLTANDIFQVGVTRVAFKEKGAPTPRNELSVRKVDQATLARSKRGGGIGMLLVLVLLLGGAAVWYFYLRDGDAGGPVRRGRVVKPLHVPGNMLQGGDLEAEDGKPFRTVSGAAFAVEFGAAASHTGRYYLLAALGEGSDAGTRHALARSSAPIDVSGGAAVDVKAFVSTSGKARAALRVRFTSRNPDEPQLLFTGTVPASYEGYTEVVLNAPIPTGCDQAEVELLALLPDADATVAVDDVALLAVPARAPNKLQTSVGQRVTWTGGAVQIDDSQRAILLGLRPVTADPVLAALAKEHLLGLSDVGVQLSVKDEAGAIVMGFGDAQGLDLVLRFEPGVAATGVLARKADAAFQSLAGSFERLDADSLLLGYGTSRFLLALPGARAVAGALDERAFELTLADVNGLRLVYDFRKERDRARGLLEEARRLAGDGAYQAVLDNLAQVIDLLPHDDAIAGQAMALRTSIRRDLADRIRHFEAELEEATYFDSLRGYRRIESGLRELLATYGRKHILEVDKIDAMLGKLAENIAKVEREVGQEARAKLEVLAEVYGKSDAGIGALIQDYIKEHLPPGDAPDPAPGTAPKKNPPESAGANKEDE